MRWIDAHTTGARSILGRALDIDEDVAQKMYLPAWPEDGRDDPQLLLPLEIQMKDLGLILSLPAPQALYDETILEAAIREDGPGR